MKNVTMLLLITPWLSFFPANLVKADPNWVRVKTDRYNDVYYVNINDIKKEGRVRYFWSNVVAGQPRKLPDGNIVKSITYYVSVDCQTRAVRIHFLRILDQNNQPYQDWDLGRDFASGMTEPGSGGDASITFVCSR